MIFQILKSKMQIDNDNIQSFIILIPFILFLLVSFRLYEKKKYKQNNDYFAEITNNCFRFVKVVAFQNLFENLNYAENTECEEQF